MNISLKIRRCLTIFFIAFLIILLKVWHLGVIQRDERIAQAQKPQQRTILIKANRGTITDRFGVCLATNQICYNAAIYYNQIAEIPRIRWIKDPQGDQKKIYPRKDYIRKLSEKLAEILEQDSGRIEDLIHSKASLFPQVPFILKSCLSEKEHYRLKMLEKDLPGIHAEISSTRFYPLGKTASNVIGTMGSIGSKEYGLIAQELSELNAAAEFLESANFERLAVLNEKAYALSDMVGKTGIEARFEEELRGFYGKKTFEVDQKGRFVKELSIKDAIAGKQIVLSISSELQKFAEDLLMISEQTREGRSLGYDPLTKQRKTLKQPWIKGGAIIAMDPNNGEILAMASHPRFDLNDFIFYSDSIFREGKTKELNRWLENEAHIGAIWDGIEALKREEKSAFKESSKKLTWENYLDTILAEESEIRILFEKLDTVKKAIQFQEDFEAMLYHQRMGNATPKELQQRLNAISLSDEDKIFAADICRMAIYAPAFTNELIDKVGSMKISNYRELCQRFIKEEKETKEVVRIAFRKQNFQKWRNAHEKEFLKEKRKIEKENGTYAKPYIDYLDKKEKELFEAFWETNKWAYLKIDGIEPELLRTFRPFSELTRPLLGNYSTLRKTGALQIEKDLAAAFYPKEGFGFNRSFASESSVPLGSVFKLVTAYEALRQNQHFTFIDQVSPKGVGYTSDHVIYPRLYKGGRLPRSAHPNMGKIDLISALEQSSNPYFSILAADFFNDPEDLIQAAKLFGFGEKTGIDLPFERNGNLPKDLKRNKTGLYSTAIGQHTLLTTPLQTALMLSTIANKGKLFRPKLVKKCVGKIPDRLPLASFEAPAYLAQKELAMIGIPYALFTSAQKSIPLESDGEIPSEIRREIPMDDRIHSKLIEGMNRVVSGPKGSAKASKIKTLLTNPILMRDYLALEDQMIGKTGTAEISLNLSYHPSAPSHIYKYIWFGGISFTDSTKQTPELVVVVFLRFADAGKEAAPLAAQMIHKWREIKKSKNI